MPVVVGLDWERDGWRVSYCGQPAVRMSRGDLLADEFPGVDLLIVEQAHMRERNIYSVAQVYSKDELLRLAARGKVKLFPGMPGQLSKAARAVGNISGAVNNYGHPLPDKTKDAETMALFAMQSPARVASWKPLVSNSSRTLWEPRNALRDDLREVLNPLRSAWNSKGIHERYALPEVADFCALLSQHYEHLPAAVREQFGISQKRLTTKDGTPTAASRVANGIRVERMSAAITCYLLVYTRDGQLRVRPDGRFIGIRFILDAVGMSSSYVPNMARSQLTHHGMRNYKGGRDGGCRSEYMRNLRHFLQFLRDASGSLTLDSELDSLTYHSGPSIAQEI